MGTLLSSAYYLEPHSQARPCEDAEKSGLPQARERGFHSTLDYCLLVTGLPASRDTEKKALFLGHSVHYVLLWHPRVTGTDNNRKDCLL